MNEQTEKETIVIYTLNSVSLLWLLHLLLQPFWNITTIEKSMIKYQYNSTGRTTDRYSIATVSIWNTRGGSDKNHYKCRHAITIIGNAKTAEETKGKEIWKKEHALLTGNLRARGQVSSSLSSVPSSFVQNRKSRRVY